MNYINPLKNYQAHLDYILNGSKAESAAFWIELWSRKIKGDYYYYENSIGWSHLKEVMIVASQTLQEDELKAIDIGG